MKKQKVWDLDQWQFLHIPCSGLKEKSSFIVFNISRSKMDQKNREFMQWGFVLKKESHKPEKTLWPDYTGRDSL